MLNKDFKEFVELLNSTNVEYLLVGGSEAVIQLGYPPARIDLLTAIDGVSFSDCYRRRQSFDVDGVTLQLIDVDDLKANKRAAARPKDLADLDALDASGEAD